MSDKATWRTRLAAARRAVPDAERAADAAAVAAALPALLAGVEGPVCLHVPVGSEPGRGPDGALPLLDAALALGHRVLLPVVVGDAPLDWAEHTGPDGLTTGPHRLLEPAGPRLGPDAVADAGVVVVPALAVDRRGVRLGRGGGHYDRTLPLARRARIVALVRDDELVDALPVETHDVRVHVVWRARAGPVAVGPAADDGTA